MAESKEKKANQVTFVTALIDLQEDRSKSKPLDLYFKLFEPLKTSINNICLFVSTSVMEEAQKAVKGHEDRIKLYEIPIDVKDLAVKRMLDQMTKENKIEIKLPSKRNGHKDTLHFLLIMNSKTEFMRKAIEWNPFQTLYFAWIDFGISHILKIPTKTFSNLQETLNETKKKSLLLFPTCYDVEISKMYLKAKQMNLFDETHWRFCGGFFFGDRTSLLHFDQSFQIAFQQFLLLSKGVLSWEVNVWAYIEFKQWFPDSFVSFTANHDESMLEVPKRLIA